MSLEHLTQQRRRCEQHDPAYGFGEHERLPTNQQFNTVCRQLEAEARRYEHSVGIRVWRRVANLQSKIQIDLSNSDGEFIEIDAEGYRVDIGKEDAAFETSASTISLPAPETPDATDDPPRSPARPARSSPGYG